MFFHWGTLIPISLQFLSSSARHLEFWPPCVNSTFNDFLLVSLLLFASCSVVAGRWKPHGTHWGRAFSHALSRLNKNSLGVQPVEGTTHAASTRSSWPDQGRNEQCCSFFLLSLTYSVNLFSVRYDHFCIDRVCGTVILCAVCWCILLLDCLIDLQYNLFIWILSPGDVRFHGLLNKKVIGIHRVCSHENIDDWGTWCGIGMRNCDIGCCCNCMRSVSEIIACSLHSPVTCLQVNHFWHCAR